MKRVTLNGIKRRGLTEWNRRVWWSGRIVTIWSREHGAWWRPEAQGYTLDRKEAWAVDFPTAYDYTKHCGPEKRIVFYDLPRALMVTSQHSESPEA